MEAEEVGPLPQRVLCVLNILSAAPRLIEAPIAALQTASTVSVVGFSLIIVLVVLLSSRRAFDASYVPQTLALDLSVNGGIRFLAGQGKHLCWNPQYNTGQAECDERAKPWGVAAGGDPGIEVHFN